MKHFQGRMKISINSLNYDSIRGLAEMGLCCSSCCSILWGWCQKKRVKESETGTVILVLYWEAWEAKWLKVFCKGSPKNLSGWEQSPDVFCLFRAQLQTVCPWYQSGKAFLLYFCSSQTENSLFYSLKPPYNTWKCLTTALQPRHTDCSPPQPRQHHHPSAAPHTGHSLISKSSAGKTSFAPTLWPSEFLGGLE